MVDETGKRSAGTTIIFTFLAELYRVVVMLRNFLYDRKLIAVYRSRLPVVCLGNITAGGNGKTPLCISIAEFLREQSYRPVILSRGYGGTTRGPWLVQSGDCHRSVGDEAVLYMRKGIDVVVAGNRVAGVKFIESLERFNVVIMDDGYQHRRLARDFNIVCADAAEREALVRLFEGRLLPLGVLREPLKAGFARADALILNRRRYDPGSQRPQLHSDWIPEGLPVYWTEFVKPRVRSMSDGAELKPGPEPVAAFCGIANPQGFWHTLREIGFSVKERMEFADHQRYPEKILQQIREKSAGMPVICTAKDAVKINPHALPGLYVLEFELSISVKEAFQEQLLYLMSRGAGRGQ